jgi:hypothetical protein
MCSHAVWLAVELDDLHYTLIKEALAGRAVTRESALEWMVVLVSQRIRLRAPIVVGLPNITVISGVTWRYAAEVIARLWRDKKRGAEAPYAEYVAPYNDYCRELSANDIDDVPEPRRSRIVELRDLLAMHPAVATVEPDS